MALSALKPQRSGSFSESVLIAVTGYKINDAAKKTPNKGGQDSITGVLMRDALGITAEFSPEGLPVTQVTVVMAPAPESQGIHKRPEILDKYKGKGQSPAVKPQGVITADGARLTSSKGQPHVITAGWINTWTPEYDQDLEFVSVAKLVEIKREGKRTDPNNPGTYQSAFMIEDQKSTKVTDAASFRAAAIEALTWIGADTEAPEMPGSPGFRIRGVEMGEDGVPLALVNDCFATWDSQNGVARTPEQAVDHFMSEQAAWIDEIESNGKVAHFEVMPVSRVSTGSQSLPTARAQTKFNTTEPSRDQINQVDEGYKNCAYPFKNEDDQTRLTTGVIRADVFSQRMKIEPDERGRTVTSWIRTRTSALPERKIYRSAEFPTDVLPAEFKAVFEENAKANFKAIVDFRKDAKKAAEVDAQPDADADAPRPM